MDPIGFSLENFDGIALWRTHDEGQPIDRDVAGVRRHEDRRAGGAAELAARATPISSSRWSAEKLLTYALGRGVEYQDMPLVRSIARDAAKNGNRFSALVLGVVKSKPFQMNTKSPEPAAPTRSTRGRRVRR